MMMEREREREKMQMKVTRRENDESAGRKSNQRVMKFVGERGRGKEKERERGRKRIKEIKNGPNMG